MYENQTNCIAGPKHGTESFVLWHQCLNALNLKNNRQIKYIKGSSKYSGSSQNAGHNFRVGKRRKRSRGLHAIAK